MNIEELNCPACKDQYNQVNPPRLLTMCGHTFCHKCIKTLITKKKDKGFKIKCPIDKGSMEMQKPNPSLFPKNMALIDLLNKNNGEFTSNEFLDVSMVQKNISKEKEKVFSERKVQNQTQSKQKAQDSNRKVCKEHNKIMDVYCVSDCEVICTDCALFSHHRFHEIKNLPELLNLESHKIKELFWVLKQKEQAEEKFMNKEMQNEIFDVLDKKKKLIQGEMSQFFTEIRKIIDEKENAMKDDLEAKGLIIAERMRDKMKMQKQSIQKYRIWQDEVFTVIQQEGQDTSEGLNKRLQNLISNDYYEGKIKDGRQIIETMSTIQEDFISAFEETLNCFTFSSHLSDIELAISHANILCQVQSTENHIHWERSLKHSRSSSYCQFQNHILLSDVQKITSQKYINYRCNSAGLHSQLPYETQKQNYSCRQDDEEESLLDFDTSFDPKPFRPSVSSCNNISVLSVPSSVNEIKAKRQVTLKPKIRQETPKRMDSSQILPKSRTRTLIISASTSSLRSIINLQNSTPTKSKKNQSRFKYQALIENILANKIDTVDLTGADPKFNQLTMILQAIQNSESVKTVKLMRNKLDDFFIEKCLKCLLSVERVNLAQNKFTQQAVDMILSILKEHPDHKIQSLNLGQNRIVERKNRKVLEEFKKLSVNIVL